MTEVTERKKKCKNYASVGGLYADLSGWPDDVSYYAKCPVCGDIHGSYKEMRQAHANRHCPACNLKQIKKIKDQIQQVIYQPEKKVKPLSAIVNEAEELPAPVPPEQPVPPVPQPELQVPEPPEDDDPLDGVDAMAEINRFLRGNWVQIAQRRLAQYLDCPIEDLVLDEEHSDDGHYDPDDPERADWVYFSEGGGDRSPQYQVFKTHDIAEGEALKRVRNDLEESPEMFSQDWLRGFIDDDKLKEGIGDPYEDHGDDVREMDYEERLQRMVDEDEIESDDQVFFKINGDPRVRTAAREQQLDAAVDRWVDSSKPDFDPWDYLEDIYPKDEVIKEALRIAGFDIEKAAKDAVDTDGWAHFMSSYDNESIELPGEEDYYAIRSQ